MSFGFMSNSSTKENTFNCIQKRFSEIYKSNDIIDHINKIVSIIYNQISITLQKIYTTTNVLNYIIDTQKSDYLSYCDLLLNYANILKNFLEEIKNYKTEDEYNEELTVGIINEHKIYRIKSMIDIIISKGKKYDFGIMCPLLIVYIVLHNKMFKQENFPASLNYISEYTTKLDNEEEKKIIDDIILEFNKSESKYTQYCYGS